MNIIDQLFPDGYQNERAKHNEQEVPRYRRLTEELGLPWLKDITLHDINNYLQMLKDEREKNS